MIGTGYRTPRNVLSLEVSCKQFHIIIMVRIDVYEENAFLGYRGFFFLFQYHK